MSEHVTGIPRSASNAPCACGDSHQSAAGVSRREFLGGAAALGGLALAAAAEAAAPANPPAGQGLPKGAALRVQPVFVWQLYQRHEHTSWRGYGGLHTKEDVDREIARIGGELAKLAAGAEFPIEMLPLVSVNTDAEADAAAAAQADALLVYAYAGPQPWLEKLAASKKPNVMFVRHRSGPIYLWYEIAHWRFLRKNEDTFKEPNMDVHDVVVDDYGDVLWRLRALYGLKNALGTKVLALGGLQSYSRPGELYGPDHAKKTWKFEIVPVAFDELAKRMAAARADQKALQEAERQTAELLAQKNVTLQTDRESVVNTFLSLGVIRAMMDEIGATNLGVAHCMGGLIPILKTPPCLVTSLLNDAGYTAFCHVDFTHTPPGVLMRWISGKPSFVANSHFPHHGMLTLAHCAAPRRMNGKDFEPTKIMTHFESDCGAATKVEYPKGQVTTNILPNLACTKWIGFRGKILDSPAFDICRSQMDIAIDGDWKKLLVEMQGFHTVITYGDYLREVGYALKRLGIAWESVTPT
ncbi:MAG: twin-arginine translocation signal domain-containing protein [Thermoguttaceae bacterium]|jgi:hypothetical protein|nr:twin-arginine translocation signal domain-containing protein [Thermoguttaceae bacterium]